MRRTNAAGMETPPLKKSKKIESPAEKCTAMLYGFLLNKNSVNEDSGNFNFVVVTGKRFGIGNQNFMLVICRIIGFEPGTFFFDL